MAVVVMKLCEGMWSVLHTPLNYLDALQLQLTQTHGDGQVQSVPQGHSQVVIIRLSFLSGVNVRTLLLTDEEGKPYSCRFALSRSGAGGRQRPPVPGNADLVELVRRPRAPAPR
jgi:hypothetical protein